MPRLLDGRASVPIPYSVGWVERSDTHQTAIRDVSPDGRWVSQNAQTIPALL